MNDDENNFDYIAHVNRWQVGCLVGGLIVWALACVGAAWLLGLT